MQIEPSSPKRITRSARERMWAGVCGGIGIYFGVDPVLIRLIFVAAAVLSDGLAVPAYFILWLVIPREDEAALPPRAPGARPYVPSAAAPSASVPTAGPAEATATTATAAPTHEPFAEPFRSESATATGQDPAPVPPPYQPAYHDPNVFERRQRVGGYVLIGLGVIFLADQMGLFRLRWDVMWPLILIGLGVALLARQSGWRR